MMQSSFRLRLLVDCCLRLLTNIFCLFIDIIILQVLELHLTLSNHDDDSYVAAAAAAGGFNRDDDSYVAPAAAAGIINRDDDSYVAPAAAAVGFPSTA